MNPISAGICWCALACAGAAWAGTASAAAASAPSPQQTPAPPTDRALISDAAQQAQGRIAINQSSGHGSLQSNQVVIGMGDAVNVVGSVQQITHRPLTRAASARIDGAAFARTQGAVSINQSAGVANAQLNVLMLGTGAMQASLQQRIAVVDDAALADIGAGMPAATATASAGLREALIGPAAFAGSQGVVQINQTAGSGNASLNAIVLQLPGAAL